MEKWFVSMKKADFTQIAEKYHISPIIARLIRNRDILGDQNIDYYLNGTIADLHDGMLMKNMDTAVEILEEKIREDEKIRVIGDIEPLDDDIKSRIRELEAATTDNGGLNFTIALNYGSRDELTRAAQKMAKDCAEGKIKAEEIDESVFETYLDTHGIPDPDMMIRTSGEQRLSNYLLWQLAYSEFYFTDVPWPDFTKEELVKAIEEYNHRHRRFGKVEEA